MPCFVPFSCVCLTLFCSFPLCVMACRCRRPSERSSRAHGCSVSLPFPSVHPVRGSLPQQRGAAKPGLFQQRGAAPGPRLGVRLQRRHVRQLGDRRGQPRRRRGGRARARSRLQERRAASPGPRRSVPDVRKPRGSQGSPRSPGAALALRSRRLGPVGSTAALTGAPRDGGHTPGLHALANAVTNARLHILLQR